MAVIHIEAANGKEDVNYTLSGMPHELMNLLYSLMMAQEPFAIMAARTLSDYTTKNNTSIHTLLNKPLPVKTSNGN